MIINADVEKEFSGELNGTEKEWYLKLKGGHGFSFAENADFLEVLNFSELRRNVLAWYTFKQEADIMEIGCGYGAITEMLASVAKNLIAYEINPNKACITAARLSTYANASIICGKPFEELDSERQFDYIVFNKSFGYQCGGSEEVNDYSDLLVKIAGRLKDNGRILIISENPLGASYVCGKPAPSSGLPYESLESSICGGKYYLFTPDEFARLVDKAGLFCKRYYYISDADFPSEVYSDDYMPGASCDERGLVLRSYSDSVLADELSYLKRMTSQGKFKEACNGFLIEIGKVKFDYQVIYSALSLDRGEDGFITSITKGEEVIKEAFSSDEDLLNNIVRNHQYLLQRGIPIIQGEKRNGKLVLPRIYAPTFLTVLKEKDNVTREYVFSLFDKLWDYILKSSETGTECELKNLSDYSNCHILQKAFIDLIPLNCFLNEEDFIFFDQEFVRNNYPAEYIMYRAINYTYYFVGRIDSIVPIEEMKDRYMLGSNWNIFVEEENRFIFNNRKKDRNGWLWALVTADYRKAIMENRRKLNDQTKRIERTNCTAEKKYHIGYVAGVFDLFHTGHVNLLRNAKEMCEYLIVGVLTDKLVKHFKGKDPVISLDDRMSVIASCRFTDEVVSVDFDSIDKMAAYEKYHFDCLFSGDDWKDSPQWVIDKKRLNDVGSDIHFFNYTKEISSTKIKSIMEETR